MPFLKITYNKADYTVDTSKRLLKKIEMPLNIICEELIIPHEFPNGEKVEVIDTQFFMVEGFVDRLIVSDGITEFRSGAFVNANIDNVFWPSTCNKIPLCCFETSNVKHLHNIEHVVEVGNSAFAYSEIKSLSWPDDCSSIPKDCFICSKIRTLDNVSHISSIGTKAFARSFLLEFLDFSSSPICSLGFHAFEGIPQSIIALPYYCDHDSFNQAFGIS